MSLSLSLCLSLRWSDLCSVHQSARHSRRMMGVGLYHSFSSSLTLHTKHIYYLKSASVRVASIREEDRGNDIVPFWEMKWWLPGYDMMSICRFCRQPTNNCSLFISVSLSLSQQHYSANAVWNEMGLGLFDFVLQLSNSLKDLNLTHPSQIPPHTTQRGITVLFKYDVRTMRLKSKFTDSKPYQFSVKWAITHTTASECLTG